LVLIGVIVVRLGVIFISLIVVGWGNNQLNIRILMRDFNEIIEIQNVTQNIYGPINYALNQSEKIYKIKCSK